MRCFKAIVEYDGTDFAGFQYQAGQRSVQAEIERALDKLTGSFVRVHGAGRTDSGVHALGQVVGFRADTRIPMERMAAALNSALPPDVSVVQAEEVDERFHARFSARSRAYAYLILRREQRSGLFARYAWHLPAALDLAAMNRAAAMLVGTRDFAAWANDTSEAGSTIRSVTRCRFRERGPWVVLSVEASGFLRGMVRNIVGTLVEVGRGRREAEEVERISVSRDRALAGPCAPARGLVLTRVRY